MMMHDGIINIVAQHFDNLKDPRAILSFGMSLITSITEQDRVVKQFVAVPALVEPPVIQVAHIGFFGVI
jgi:hypothetical protein